MRGIQRVLLILSAAAAVVGCSTSGALRENAWVRDSSLDNQHPAPKSMVPVVALNDAEAAIDATYLKAQADFHFTMGEAHSLEGRPEKAIESFKLTLVYDPGSALVRERLAVEYVRMGLLSEAMERAEEAVGIAPESINARLLYAGLLSSLKMYDKALEQYKDAQASHPANADVPIYVGAILAEQQKYAEAIDHFRKVAADPKYPSQERAHYYIGRILVEQGGVSNLKEAEKAFSAALREKPDYEEAALAYGNALMGQGKAAQAQRLLRSYQDRFGPEKEVARALAKIYLDKEEFDEALEQLEFLEGFERDNLNIRAQIALILIERKQYEQAAVRLEDILVQAPDLDKIRYYLGAVYEELKKTELAIQQYEQLPPSSSYYAEGVIHSAHLLRTEGRLGAAIQMLKKAISTRDDIPQFYAYYASVLDDQKEYQEAIRFLTSAVEKFPTQAQLHFFLGSMQDKVGDQASSISQMKKVLTIDEDHVQALNYLAYIYAERGENLADAEALARRALAKSPTDGYILDTLGWVLFKRGHTNQAIQYLEAAYQAKSDESIIAEHLGDAYFSGQLLDKAKTMYIKASELEDVGERRPAIKSKISSVDRQQERLPERTPAAIKKRTPAK